MTARSQRGSCRNSRISFRTTVSIFAELDKVWASRTYPDPQDNTKEKKFVSKSEYLEFIINALNKAGEKEFYLFKHLLNPALRS